MTENANGIPLQQFRHLIFDLLQNDTEKGYLYAV